jgi:hypothetical protein
MEYEGKNWIYLTEDRVHLWALHDLEIQWWISIIVLIWWASINFSGKILF